MIDRIEIRISDWIEGISEKDWSRPKRFGQDQKPEPVGHEIWKPDTF
jgi:hypothetical protein